MLTVSALSRSSAEVILDDNRLRQQRASPVERSRPRPAQNGAMGTREVCFDAGVLTRPDFSASEFVASVRTHAPLSVVRDDLRAHLAGVHRELVSCVQGVFVEFVGLGAAVAGVDAGADAVEAPLAALRGELEAVVEGLGGEIALLEGLLDERRRVFGRKSALELMLYAGELVGKCERLLKEHAACAKGSADSLTMVERIAGEAAQMAFTLGRAGNGAFVRSMGVRISFVRRGVRTCLEAWLRRALFPEGATREEGYDIEVLGRVLAMYVVAGLAAEAEDFFRREVVAPFAATRLRMTPMLAAAERARKQRSGNSGALSSSSPGDMPTTGLAPGASSVSAADAFECAEAEIIQFLGDKVMPIVSLCEAEERLRARLDFVGNAVWPQIEKAVSSHMAAAFSPGIPDVFHQSVLAGTRLYAAVEAAVGTDAHRDALRNSASTSDFWRRWNLPVYFQLRFQDITTTFDQSLQAGPISPPSTAAMGNGAAAPASGLLRSDVYRVSATVALVDALRRCWSEGVYLNPLAHRFLRLSLQLLARYVTWVRTGLAGEWSGADAVPKGAANVFADVIALQTRVPAEIASLLRLRAKSLSPELLEAIDAAFSNAIEGFSSLLPDLSRSISDALAASCVDILRPMRGIYATYRVSPKLAPTTHSPIVPKVLRPLRVFLEDHQGRLVVDVCGKISTAVAEQTTHEYSNMATDLLNRNKSSEASLRRLNIHRGGNAASSAGSNAGSITEKISMQLYLDVAKFMEEIKSLGVSIDDVPSIQLLWDRVNREDTSQISEAKSEVQAEAKLEPATAPNLVEDQNNSSLTDVGGTERPSAETGDAAGDAAGDLR